MDKFTKDLFAMILRNQNQLGEQNTAFLKLLASGRSEINLQFKAIGEAITVISRIEDSDTRRKALDAIWAALDQSEAEKQSRALLAKLETAQEHLGAQTESLLVSLQALGTDEADGFDEQS